MYFFTIAAAAAYLGFSVVQAGALAERAVVNGPCTGSGGAPGVCIPTAKCSEKGGKFINNACPNTPDNIKCCTKASCGNGGDCRWASACQGTTLNNQCPGPASFKCCVPKRPGDTGDNGSPFPKPRLPTVGACQAKAVNGAKKIIEANPGDTREIQCKRGCECEPKNPKASDHCCGMAVDLMCSSKAGVRTESGRKMAEWIMHHREELNLKYVIWGQKKWNVDIDKVTSWPNWRPMDDRKSITKNHWDHVHVSFK